MAAHAHLWVRIRMRDGAVALWCHCGVYRILPAYPYGQG
jgi:hypothetical protein